MKYVFRSPLPSPVWVEPVATFNHGMQSKGPNPSCRYQVRHASNSAAVTSANGTTFGASSAWTCPVPAVHPSVSATNIRFIIFPS